MSNEQLVFLLRTLIGCPTITDDIRQQARDQIASLTHETFDGPTPHHVKYDMVGWLCFVCGGWNRDTWTSCSHPHAQKARES